MNMNYLGLKSRSYDEECGVPVPSYIKSKLTGSMVRACNQSLGLDEKTLTVAI